MPELPEVETIKRKLDSLVAGLTITGVNLITPKIVRAPEPDLFIENLVGQKIRRVGRRGKFLLFYLNNDLLLAVHLRMTGRIVYHAAGAPVGKHTHVVISLSNNHELHYADIRKFGRMALLQAGRLEEWPGLNNLGVEPLSDNFTRDFLKKELRTRRTKIKPLLLDQTIIAGLGNIYADEALYRAKINPEKSAANLTPRELARLYLSIREVLEEGIANRGTTIRDYVDSGGEAGENQNNLRVYGREGCPCEKCKHLIARIRLAGRSTYFCPKCQR